MACSGCTARREWINKWSKIAYERAKELLERGNDPAPAEPEARQRPDGTGHEGDAERRQ